MKIGQKIYQLRRQLGLSQEALAERVNVTRQAVSKWELGTSVPELETVVALARTFGVTTDYLLSDEDAVPRPEEAAASTAPQQDWLERLPGFIGKLFRRFGWLCGVYIAAVGTALTAMGALARYMVRQMLGSFDVGFPTIWDGVGGYSGFPDDFSSIVVNSDIPGFSDYYAQQLQQAAANNPVSILGTFMIVAGIILIIGGIVLAVYLKKKHSLETV